MFTVKKKNVLNIFNFLIIQLFFLMLINIIGYKIYNAEYIRFIINYNCLRKFINFNTQH